MPYPFIMLIKRQFILAFTCGFLLTGLNPMTATGQHLASDPVKEASKKAGPEMTVRGQGLTINPGDTIPREADNTSFGSVEVFGEIPKHRFVIANTGDEILQMRNPGTIQLKGTDSLTFKVKEEPQSRLGPGDQTSFKIQFDPDTQKLQTATVEIRSNDSTRTPYTFRINGTGVRSTNTQLKSQKENPIKVFQKQNGFIRVSFQETVPKKRLVTLYNIKGKVVRHQYAQEGIQNLTIKTTDLSPGLYIVQTHSAKGFHSKKLRIQ